MWVNHDPNAVTLGAAADIVTTATWFVAPNGTTYVETQRGGFKP